MTRRSICARLRGGTRPERLAVCGPAALTNGPRRSGRLRSQRRWSLTSEDRNGNARMTGIQTAEMVDHEDRHWWHVGRRRILCDVLTRCKLPPQASLLDAGCGAGGMLSVLSAYGSVSGLDMNPDLVALARRRGYEDVREGVVEE